MKRLLAAILPVLCGAVALGDGVTLTATDAEVVMGPGSSEAVLLAVEEMTNGLSAVLGAPIPAVSAPTPGKRHLYLGSNDWTVAAGIDTAALRRDAARIVVKGGDVFIAGRDDPQTRILRALSRGHDVLCEKGTANGVYEFLERFAGVRYYFPGPLGTILPCARSLQIPETDFVTAPDYTSRFHSTGPDVGSWPDFELPTNVVRRSLALQERRLRMQTERIPCCHGQYAAKLPQRFAKTHPEYFRLDADGRRRDYDTEKPPYCQNAHLCLTSDVWEEIYRDARSYLKGEDPSVRGMLRGKAPNYKCDWPGHAQRRLYYDIMPNDGLGKCVCPRCQAAFAKAKDPKDWANEIVWGHTVDIANRLKAEGIGGFVTQMAYSPYRNVPEVDIPDNVKVMVAQKGPWAAPAALAAGEKLIRAWGEKTRGAVWLWTYVGKYGALKGTTDGIPCGTPRAMGRYWKGLANLIFGGYSEDGTDRWLHHYLDTYVFSKVCWNNATDVEALLAEHDRLMFGPAATEMGMVIRIMEDAWLRIGSNTIETPLGPLGCAPTDDEIYLKIYGPKVIARLDELYAKAESLVRPGSLEARRIALYRREYFLPVREKATHFQELSDVARWRKFIEDHPERVLKGPFVLNRKYPGKLVPDADGRGFTMTSDPASHGVRVLLRMPDFKYGRRYRVSWFVKGENIVPDKGGCGHYAYFLRGRVFAEDSVRTPMAGRLTGTFDWRRQAFEFTRAENTKDMGRFTHPLGFNNLGCTGTVSVRDVVVEELE